MLTDGERPKTRDELNDWFASLNVKGDFATSTLDEYFKTVQGWLRGDMIHLRGPIETFRKKSWRIRFAAFIAVAAGVLLPLPIFGALDDRVGGLELGYLAILIGGLLLLYDQVFTISNSWIRLTMFEMQVKQVRYRLELEWAKRRPTLTEMNGASEGPALIDILKTAADASHEIMESQKLAWTNEIRQGLETLKGRLNEDRIMLERLRTERVQERAKPKTGALNFTIDKPAGLKAPLIVKVGGEQRLRLEAIPATLSLNGIAAGLQTITVEAERASNAGKFIAMSTQEIAAGEVKSVKLEVG